MGNTNLLLIAAAASTATLRLLCAVKRSDASMPCINSSSVASMAKADLLALNEHCTRTGQDLSSNPLFSIL